MLINIEDFHKKYYHANISHELASEINYKNNKLVIYFSFILKEIRSEAERGKFNTTIMWSEDLDPTFIPGLDSDFSSLEEALHKLGYKCTTNREFNIIKSINIEWFKK
jgi:hypothetical protein